jgi:hypothetical protein
MNKDKLKHRRSRSIEKSYVGVKSSIGIGRTALDPLVDRALHESVSAQQPEAISGDLGTVNRGDASTQLPDGIQPSAENEGGASIKHGVERHLTYSALFPSLEQRDRRAEGN